MSRIKHIALHTPDTNKTADFYKEVFGLEELGRAPKEDVCELEEIGRASMVSGENAIWLTDGYIFFAILKFGNEKEAPNLGEGPSTVEGVHHIGFYVDDIDESVAAFQGAGGTECPGSSHVNRKYKGPDGLMVDMVPWATPYWDNMIRAKSQLLEASPVGGPDLPADEDYDFEAELGEWNDMVKK